MEAVRMIAMVINIIVMIALVYIFCCVTEIGIMDFISMCKNEKGYALILAAMLCVGIWGYLKTWGVIIG